MVLLKTPCLNRQMFRCFNPYVLLRPPMAVLLQVTEAKMSDLSKKLPSELSQQALEAGGWILGQTEVISTFVRSPQMMQLLTES